MSLFESVCDELLNVLLEEGDILIRFKINTRDLDKKRIRRSLQSGVLVEMISTRLDAQRSFKTFQLMVLKGTMLEKFLIIK